MGEYGVEKGVLGAEWLPSGEIGLRRQVYKTAWVIAGAIVLALVAALLLVVLSTFRNAERFEPLEAHLGYVNALRKLQTDLEILLGEALPDGAGLPDSALEGLAGDLTAIHALGQHLDGRTPGRIQSLLDRLDELRFDIKAASPIVLTLVNEMIEAELVSRSELVRTISSELRFEKRIALALLFLVPVSALGILLVLRHSIVAWVQSMAELLSVLGTGEFNSIPLDKVQPILRPAFENYNDLVGRLKELESQQRDRQASLEEQVRLANQRMMRLHRTLSNSEKLAVVGEVAASIAHELRNPLAGIRAALNNLRSEIVEPPQAARLDLVNNELKRMTSLLNNLLEQTSHTPEAPAVVDIGSAMHEVGKLAELQLDSRVQVRYQIAPGLRCSLPEDRFRQTILNLVLNSGQAMGEKGGTIDLAAHPGSEGNSIEITVTDSGPGFPQAVVESGPRAFASSRIHGTGLGSPSSGGSHRISVVLCL